MTTKYNLKSTIRSALRRVWLYSPMRRDAMAKARESRGIYRCSKCFKCVGPKEIDIDHVIPATPPQGIENPSDWGTFIERLLYCDPSNLVGVCKPCHKMKTSEERRERKAKTTKKKTSKKLIRRTTRVHSRRTRKDI